MLSEDKAPAEHLLLEKGVPEAEKKNLEGNVKEAAETSCPRPEPREGEGRTVDPPHDALDSEEGGRGAGEEGRHSRDAGDLARHSPASVEGGDGGEMTKEKEGSTSLLLDGEDTVTEKCPTPDLSDPTETFFDLLCQFQSRRMNDQRCSFRRKPRGDTRPWRSAPSSPVGERRAVFASALSLQTEEFFDLVAWSQARRLDDQRAEPLENELRAAEPRDGREAGRLAEREARKTWRKVRQRAVTEPCAAPDEELYNTILTHQAERIEEQRSDPPLPPAARDLFDLLLRLQGERMDEQRVELPPALLRREVNPC
ncbi:G-protein-signaling modulator 3 isoform X2 [Rhinatrema bivittatum]|uniref:G-protein-signaling modulator 3 isoform X2 n=1 Tax=Rhinatrema bivittatum TaxID=194408 RepID=UPI00112B69AB|nr:G-protein-signaling modulator 3 isoform X2 [Rhinatrema bivittatum]